MERHATTPIPLAGRPFSSQVAATSAGVAAADQAHLTAALEGVGWERRGLLQTLARRPRLRSASPPPR